MYHDLKIMDSLHCLFTATKPVSHCTVKEEVSSAPHWKFHQIPLSSSTVILLNVSLGSYKKKIEKSIICSLVAHSLYAHID